jgi:hypothetical protein
VTCGGDSGNRIFVLYWRCPLIRVSVIRGSLYYVLMYVDMYMSLGGVILIPEPLASATHHPKDNIATITSTIVPHQLQNNFR